MNHLDRYQEWLDHLEDTSPLKQELYEIKNDSNEIEDRFYQELLKLRADNDAFTTGDFEVISAPEDDFFVFIRTAGDDKWAVVCNFEEERNIKLPFECEEPALSNLGRDTADGTYAPYECAVARAR